MMQRIERIAAVIAAHPDHQVIGETRLQRTIKLLQRVGLDTDYRYSFHFYGPYSEELRMETSVSDELGLIRARLVESGKGNQCCVFSAENIAARAIGHLAEKITHLSKTTDDILDLATVYDSYRENGADREQALAKLRIRRVSQCTPDKEAQALHLLNQIGLN